MKGVICPMQSLRELYKIGRGPSSSHSIGPDRASRKFKSMYPNADHYKAILYGSLSLTGKGHQTDEVIIDAFAPLPIEVVFDNDTPCDVHPNTMYLFPLSPGLSDSSLSHFQRLPMILYRPYT